jgi:hypothetical protein
MRLAHIVWTVCIWGPLVCEANAAVQATTGVPSAAKGAPQAATGNPPAAIPSLGRAGTPSHPLQTRSVGAAGTSRSVGGTGNVRSVAGLRAAAAAIKGPGSRYRPANQVAGAGIRSAGASASAGARAGAPNLAAFSSVRPGSAVPALSRATTHSALTNPALASSALTSPALTRPGKVFSGTGAIGGPHAPAAGAVGSAAKMSSAGAGSLNGTGMHRRF